MSSYADSIRNIQSRIQEITVLPFEKIKSETLNHPFLQKNSGFAHHLEKAREIKAADNSIDGIIQNQAMKTGLDPDLLRAVIKTESNFNEKAVSPKGALGLMQLMPDTASVLGVTNPMDPEENIAGGAEYLKDMLSNFGQLDKALAAYNAGPGAVNKYGGVPPYKETRNYIEKVGKYYNALKKNHNE